MTYDLLTDEAVDTSIGITMDPLPGRDFPDFKSENLHARFQIGGGKGVFSKQTLATHHEGETPTRGNSLTSRATIVSNERAPILRTDAEYSAPCWDAFAFRVRQFLSGLSPQRRAEIARRIRFYSLPWIRLTTEPDSDDLP